MANPRRRRCKICREWFHPKYENIEWCSPEHGAELAIKRRSKEREKLEAKLKKEQKQKEVKARDKLKARKLAVKPRSYWIKQAQQAVNAYIRERDRGLPCISCGTFQSAQWDAGHYRTTAAAPQLRFDERNIHRQCVVCNQHKSGNLVPYRVELINRIGQKAVESIECDHDRHKWTIDECKTIKEVFRKKLKELKDAG
ncbi:recombination protein NinG [Providencia rettgeri]